jgi:hypothetical protein
MGAMDIYRFRRELKNLTNKELLEMAFKQKKKKCVLLGGPCRYKMTYEGAGFCLSELFGKGCEMDYLCKLLADEDAETKCQRPGQFSQLPIGLRFPDIR